MQEHCLICNRVEMIKEKSNPYFVKELKTGYVVMGDFQFFKGYTLFLCKKHKIGLHELDLKFRKKFLEEMSLVGEAVYNAFGPEKINYELLGNTDHHLHWHLFPRHKNDPYPKGPIWLIDKKIRCAASAKPKPAELEKLKTQLKKELNKSLR